MGLLLSPAEATELDQLLSTLAGEHHQADRDALQEAIDRWRIQQPGKVVASILRDLEQTHQHDKGTGLCRYDGQSWPCATWEKALVAQGEVEELIAGLIAIRPPEPPQDMPEPGPKPMADRVRHWRDRNGLKVVVDGDEPR